VATFVMTVIVLVAVVVLGWVILSSGLLAKSVENGRDPFWRPPARDALAYRVPEGQDPAVIVAALKKNGFEPSSNTVDGIPMVMVPQQRSRPEQRQRVREAIASARTTSLTEGRASSTTGGFPGRDVTRSPARASHAALVENFPTVILSRPHGQAADLRICVMDVVSTQRPPGSDQHGAMSFVPASGRARRADHARTGLGLAVIAATAGSAYEGPTTPAAARVYGSASPQAPATTPSLLRRSRERG
jgi:hypothetical protein